MSGGYLTNRRPAGQTEWCVGNANYNERVQEPSGTKKQIGWNDGEQPPAVLFNWLFNLTHRWLKNLDERTPKVPEYDWTVNHASNRPTDKDFESIQDALAASNVFSGDVIFVVLNPSLTEPLTITKSCRIVFHRGGYVYGDVFNANVKIIIDAENVEIIGGEFLGFHTTVFELTANARNCAFRDCFFGDTETPINDDAVPPGYTPVITGCSNYLF